jgi:Flp pilus assembly CpaF family ATPase
MFDAMEPRHIGSISLDHALSETQRWSASQRPIDSAQRRPSNYRHSKRLQIARALDIVKVKPNVYDARLLFHILNCRC